MHSAEAAKRRRMPQRRHSTVRDATAGRIYKFILCGNRGAKGETRNAEFKQLINEAMWAAPACDSAIGFGKAYDVRQGGITGVDASFDGRFSGSFGLLSCFTHMLSCTRISAVRTETAHAPKTEPIQWLICLSNGMEWCSAVAACPRFVALSPVDRGGRGRIGDLVVGAGGLVSWAREAMVAPADVDLEVDAARRSRAPRFGLDMACF